MDKFMEEFHQGLLNTKVKIQPLGEEASKPQNGRSCKDIQVGDTALFSCSP